MNDAIKELESRIIERVVFWDGYISMLIRLRDAGVRAADKSPFWKVSASEHQLKEGLRQAIDTAMQLQRDELAECFMLTGIGGKRAMEYAKQRAKDILGEEALEFASRMGWVPTYWAQK